MIFQRAALREFTHTAVAVFTALAAILLTIILIRLLGQAAGGKLAPEAVVALLGFSAIGYLPVLLSLTLFISVLMTLSRWYRDSEMIIWLGSGMPLTAWIKPVFKYSFPLVLGIALLSLLLAPWTMQQGEIYRQKIDNRGDVARVSPGTFNESAAGDRIFFVESGSGQGGIVKNIFVSSAQQGHLGVMATAQGHTETMPNGDKFLVLDRGRRYEGTAGTPEYRVMEFDRYALRIETKETRNLADSPRTKPLLTLLRDPQPEAKAELLWRVGLPLAALNLVFFAIPLSFVNARAGRTNNLIFALLTYMIYSNLLSISQAWVAQGKLRFELGVWAIHFVMFLLLAILFYHRQNPLTLARIRWR
uniref:Lipopolysaccharide export system permease protein LptF n=1 Tax=uncultured bacterium P11N2 TaxID=1748282 RepID=A0A0U3U8W3_9BACT|nr:permease [uncultured bacterium P11N2]